MSTQPLPRPVTLTATVTFRSYDPSENLVERVRDCIQTHPTLSFRVDEVTVSQRDLCLYVDCPCDIGGPSTLDERGICWQCGRLNLEMPEVAAAPWVTISREAYEILTGKG